MTDTVPIGLIVVRLTQPVKNYPVGTELGYKDVPDAIAALGSAAFFEVVRDQQGNPIPPLTPEEIEEAQRAAQRRAKSRRLIVGADFDPLWDRVEGIPDVDELEQMRQDVDAVADVPPRVEAVERDLAALTLASNPGRTLSVVGDLHVGFGPNAEQQAAATARIDATFSDLATLAGQYARRIYVGDQIEAPTTTGTSPGGRDTDFLARANALDPNWLAVAGNHDTNSARTATHWANVYGMPGQNYAVDLGFCRIIAIASDGGASPSSALSSATLAFLDAELRKSRKDTVILCHYPLFGTVAPHPIDKGYSTYGAYTTSAGHAQPDAAIRAILDRHPQARIWLCGHSHSPLTAPDLFTHAWTGSRHIAVVNAGSPTYTDGNAGALGTDPPLSLFLTMLDDRAEIRVRDHQARTWRPFTYEYAYSVRWNLPAVEIPRTENPAAMVMTFDGEIVGRDRSGPAAFTHVGTASWDTTDGLQGLVLDSADAVVLDPRPWLTPDTGSIVVRARFTSATDAGTNYLIYHNPSGLADHRLNIYRNSSGILYGQLGGAALNATARDTMDNTAIHTFGLSWRDGWFASLHVDGERQAYGLSSTDLSKVLTQIGSELRLGQNIRGAVIYDLYLATRELSDGEHARLHQASEHWSWDILDPYRATAASVTPTPEPPPLPANPTTMIASFNNEIVATDRNGPATYNLIGSEAYDSTAGRTGLELISSKALEWDAREWVTPTQGTIAMRARFVNPTSTSSEYLVNHSPSSPADHRLHMFRAPTAFRGQIGAAQVNANAPTPMQDTDIHTFAISWRNGWELLLYIDGVHVATGRSNTTSGAGALTEIGDVLRTGSGANIVIYDLLMSDKELSAEQHATLHAAETWAWDTLA